MATARRIDKKKTVKRTITTDKAMPNLSVVTVRISDAEKDRIDAIMKHLDIKRYSDVMRMALQMVKLQPLA